MCMYVIPLNGPLILVGASRCYCNRNTNGPSPAHVAIAILVDTLGNAKCMSLLQDKLQGLLYLCIK